MDVPFQYHIHVFFFELERAFMLHVSAKISMEGCWRFIPKVMFFGWNLGSFVLTLQAKNRSFPRKKHEFP